MGGIANLCWTMKLHRISTVQYSDDAGRKSLDAYEQFIHL